MVCTKVPINLGPQLVQDPLPNGGKNVDLMVFSK